MPTVTEDLQTIRGAATVNVAALTSVRTQVTAHLALANAWPNSPNKGRVRDQLGRLAAAFDQTKIEAQRVITACNAAIGTGGTDPTPATITWSTADF
jgi:hypothetical protein